MNLEDRHPANILGALRAPVEALGAAVDADELAAILTELGHLDALAELARFDPRVGTRRVLFRSGQVECALVAWAPDQGGMLHTHGPGAHAWRVLRGAAQEVLVSAGRRPRLRATRRGPGEVSAVQPDTLHAISSVDPTTPLVTLHLSVPRHRQGADAVRVAVVGGGPSGVAMAAALARQGISAVLFERGPLPGRGRAGEADPACLSAAPARALGIDETDPLAFFRWARERTPGLEPDAPVPRVLYGR